MVPATGQNHPGYPPPAGAEEITTPYLRVAFYLTKTNNPPLPLPGQGDLGIVIPVACATGYSPLCLRHSYLPALSRAGRVQYYFNVAFRLI